mmetsp:Transcript_20464/g.68711  ORF Transcript_20464/g.68711 Transcript_20464/m.68711 type:complete len:418 (-) Transcript_20464:351-1604(-)
MASILRFAKSSPLLFGIGYSGAKTSFCDLMVQKVVEKREEIDWKRNAAFATFGFFYLGGVQYALYVPIFGRLFPNAANFAAKPVAEKLRDLPGIRNLFAQVFLDQCVHHPLMYFPVFYMIKDAVTSPQPDPKKAIEKYVGNMQEDMIALWKVWVPSTFLNFAFMPMWLRIPWVASTSLVWTCILSAMRGGDEVVPTTEPIGPLPDSQSMELFQRTIANPPPVLDASKSHVIVSVLGPDRPGIVAELTKRILECEGNLTTSKMVKLGGDFAVTMHVDCAPEKLAELKRQLKPSQFAAFKGINIQAHELSLDSGEPRPYAAHVRLTGPDKPGLLASLTKVLAAHNLNIEHLQTETHMPPRSKSADRLFTVFCHLTATQEPDQEQLKADLNVLREDLGVVLDIERITSAGVLQRLPTTKS